MRNNLGGSSSPYLRQHADNPVHWQQWGEEAMEWARERNVPILLSIGYSACHWCHVMAHESFENDEIAAVMNANFVCVKVDREERPDIDAVYMNATVAMTGQGGWPMTCFLTPRRFTVLLRHVLPADASRRNALVHTASRSDSRHLHESARRGRQRGTVDRHGTSARVGRDSVRRSTPSTPSC